MSAPRGYLGQVPQAPPRPTTDLNPAPAPMTAETMLLALIKANQAERTETQNAIDLHTQEASRLDAIADGLKAALRAVRYPKASAPSAPA